MTDTTPSYPPVEKYKVGVLFLVEGARGPLVAVFARHARNNRGNQVNDDIWFDVPGGKYAEGEFESIWDGAIREIHEEIGVTLSMDDFRAAFADTHRHPKTPTTETRFVLAVCPEGQYPQNVHPAENGHLLFLRPDKAAEYLGDRASEEVHDYLKILHARHLG